MIIIDFALTFPDRDTAVAIFAALQQNPDATELPSDGWLNGIYFNLYEAGLLYEPRTEPVEDPENPPEPIPIPGYHVIGRWCGDEALFPETLRPHLVDVDSLPIRFG